MNFQTRRTEAPEINLIPFIDVLLVVLIFLMLSTTYNKFTEMTLTLPLADAEPQRDRPREIIVSVAADGSYAINQGPVDGSSVPLLSRALATAAAGQQGQDSVLIISADAMASHQSVISVMEAARHAGLAHITFATQKSAD